ncbi:MAG: hypothetical protein JNM17_27720, partial [Archangium sp.]|nr:hypothetical protein [Archangium sp.]
MVNQSPLGRRRWVGNRLHLFALLVGVTAGFISACSVYNPTVRDCALRCSDEGTCPGGTTCVEGFCRPPGFSGACDCNVGDSESCGGGMGECRQGLRICLDTRIWGPCLGEVRATTELCDGKDNDCDGMIDDSVSQAPACPLTQGVCQFSAQQCVDGGFINNCGPASYGSQYELVEQSCDGVDNDCDGNVDQRSTVNLLNAVDSFVALAVPGGYYIVYTDVNSLTQVRVQRFDDFLQPMGDAGILNAGASNIAEFTERVTSGGTVAVGLLRNDGTT